MTDNRQRPTNITYYNTTRRDRPMPREDVGRVRSTHGNAPATAPTAGKSARRRSAAKGRIAAAGIGIAAMVGLVANMEIASGRTKPPAPTPRVALVTQNAALGSARVAAANTRRAIVRKPHVVVRTVGGSSAGGSGGGSGYSAAPAAVAAAPVPATAPAASTGGSY